MKRCLATLVLILSLVQSKNALSQPASRYQGTVIGKNGVVERSPSSAATWSSVAIRQALALDEQVRTDANAAAAILLKQGGQVRLDERALLKLSANQAELLRG